MDAPQPSQRKGMRLSAVVGLMAVSFAGGVGVGMHPAWIPVPSWVPAGLPAGTGADRADGMSRAESVELSSPAPTTQPMAEPPATRPDSMDH